MTLQKHAQKFATLAAIALSNAMANTAVANGIEPPVAVEGRPDRPQREYNRLTCLLGTTGKSPNDADRTPVPTWAELAKSSTQELFDKYFATEIVKLAQAPLFTATGLEFCPDPQMPEGVEAKAVGRFSGFVCRYIAAYCIDLDAMVYRFDFFWRIP